MQGRGARAKGQALVLSVSDVEYNRQDVIGAHYRSVIDAINSLPAGTHTLTVELDYATNDDDDYPWMESHHFSSHYLLNFYGTLVDDSGGDGVLVGGRTALKETGTIHNFAHHAKTFTFKIVEANAPKPRPEGTFERGKFRGFKAGVIVNNKLDAAVLEASILVVDNLAMRLNGGPLIYRNTFDASGPDADADGVIDACQACDDRVDSDGDQINDCSEQRDGSEWTDPLVFNGPMVERGIAGTLPACSALTEPALDQYLAANAPTQRQHMASGWSNWGTYQTNSCGASYDFSPQWSSCPSPWYAHYNAEFSVEDPGYHCFSISQNHSCAALYVDGTAISANQARRCFHRQSGVLPIRWFTQPSSGFYQTNAVRNLTLNVRYCYGQDAECEPVSVLPQSLLRSGESTCMAALVGRANADYTATALKVINRQFTPAQSLALSRDRKRRMRAARADVSLAARLCDRSDVDGDWVIDSEDQCPGTPDLIATDDRGCPLATLPRAPSAEMVAGLLDETQITFNPNCTTAPVPNTVSAGLFHRITSNAHRGAYVFAGRVTNQPSGCPVWYHFEIDESGRVNRRYLASFKDTEELSAAFGNGSPVPRGLIQFRTGSGDTGTRAWLAEPKHGVTTRVRVRAMNANGARGPWSDWRSTTCNDCLRMGLACTWLCEQELITATGDVTVAR
ncbi:MAG TPA: hypothetical protein VI072_17590 [Polyangiaceae bacterium]